MSFNVLRRRQHVLLAVRHFSRVSPPPPACGVEPVIRVSNHISHLGLPKQGPKPRQLLSLPPFPAHPLPGKDSATCGQPSHITAISWVKYYFDGVPNPVIQSLFNKGLVSTIFFIFLIFYLFLAKDFIGVWLVLGLWIIAYKNPVLLNINSPFGW